MSWRRGHVFQVVELRRGEPESRCLFCPRCFDAIYEPLATVELTSCSLIRLARVLLLGWAIRKAIYRHLPLRVARPILLGIERTVDRVRWAFRRP